MRFATPGRRHHSADEHSHATIEKHQHVHFAYTTSDSMKSTKIQMVLPAHFVHQFVCHWIVFNRFHCESSANHGIVQGHCINRVGGQTRQVAIHATQRTKIVQKTPAKNKRLKKNAKKKYQIKGLPKNELTCLQIGKACTNFNGCCFLFFLFFFTSAIKSRIIIRSLGTPDKYASTNSGCQNLCPA